MDSLLSIVQMPGGIPVATVAINNARNAALLAVRILSVGHPDLRDRLEAYARTLGEQVEEKARALERQGYRDYLSSLQRSKEER